MPIFPCSSSKIGCEARLVLQAEHGDRQYLRITKLKDKHCHVHVQPLAQFYPENRRLTETDIEEVEKMTIARGKPINIREHLRETTGRAVIEKDLANLQ